MMINEISQSMLNTASRCGEQFRRIYIEGERIPPAVAAARGTAVHKTAAKNHENIKNNNEQLPLEAIVDLTATAYMDAIKEGVSMTKEEAENKESVLSEGLDASVRLAMTYRNEVAPRITKPILIEERVSVDMGMDLPLAGTIDLLHENGNKKILDLKTASKKKSEGYGVGNLQATAYTILGKSVVDETPDVEFAVLVDTQKSVEQTIKAVVQETDELALKARMMNLIRMINSGIFPPANPTDSWWCSPKWCGYYTTCPYVSQPKTIQITEEIQNE